MECSHLISSQLTNSIIFQRVETTNQIRWFLGAWTNQPCTNRYLSIIYALFVVQSPPCWCLRPHIRRSSRSQRAGQEDLGLGRWQTVGCAGTLFSDKPMAVSLAACFKFKANILTAARGCWIICLAMQDFEAMKSALMQIQICSSQSPPNGGELSGSRHNRFYNTGCFWT
jgi:hypothetical protein